MRRVMAGLVVAFFLIAPSAAQAQESEVVSLARELVQVNTSNPPGNEAQVAELLAPRLRRSASRSRSCRRRRPARRT